MIKNNLKLGEGGVKLCVCLCVAIVTNLLCVHTVSPIYTYLIPAVPSLLQLGCAVCLSVCLSWQQPY